MVNYQEGKIYIIRNTVNDKVYVGSTTLSLEKRLCKHKDNRHHANMRIGAEMIRIGIDKFFIELIKNHPCNSKQELNAEEGRWIRHYNSTGENGLNGKNEGLTLEQQKEYVSNYNKQYEQQMPQEQKEKRNTKKRERVRCPHCEKEVSKGGLARHINVFHTENPKAPSQAEQQKRQEYSKEWREKNRETLLQKKKEYYQKHKESLSEKGKEKVVCHVCNKEMSQSSIKAHVKLHQHPDQPSTSQS